MSKIFFQIVFCLIALLLSTSTLAQDPSSEKTLPHDQKIEQKVDQKLEGKELDPVPSNTAATPLEQNFQESFQSGVKFYQEKKYNEAKERFSRALELQPENIHVLTNLGLTYYQLGQKGFALALFRKAQQIDPDFSTPLNAIEFTQKQLEIKEIPHAITQWENIRKYLIQPFSQFSFTFLSALLLLTAGLTWIKYFSAKKKAENEEKPYPAVPILGIIYSVMFTLLFGLMIGKLYDESRVRGTVISEKSAVLSLPDEKAPALFDIYSGLEVIVLQKKDNWLQIQYPGGMTGWLKDDQVFITTRKKI